MLRNRILSILLTGILATGAFTACGQASAPEPAAPAATPAPAAPADPATPAEPAPAETPTGTIEFYLQKANIKEIMEDLIARFEAENPGMKVELTSVPDPETALVTRIASNDIPDVISIWPAELFYRDLMRDGVLMDLSDQAFMNKVNPSTRAIAQYDGKDYAYSMTMSAYGIIVNNKIFAENGISKPTTWDELIKACDTLKANGIQAFAFYDKSTEQLGQMAERLIGVVNNDITSQFMKVGKGATSWANEKEMTALAEAMIKLREYGQVDTLGSAYDDAMNALAAEKAAMMLYGSWGVQTILKINPDLDIEMIPLPDPTGGKTNVAVSIDSALCITESSENKAVATKFLEFMASDEIAQHYADTEKNPTTVIGVNYNIDQLKAMAAEISNGNVFFTPSLFWPAGFRKSWEAPLQQLIIDKNIDAFNKSSDEISVEYLKDM